MTDKEFQESFASLRKSIDDYKAATAQEPGMTDEKMHKMHSDIMDRMHGAISYLHDRVDMANAAMQEHRQGHLPNCKTASQMEKCLKAMGMHEDFEVQKPMISMAKVGRKILVSAEYRKNG